MTVLLEATKERKESRGMNLIKKVMSAIMEDKVPFSEIN
jgi:hypothetical protein